MTAFCADLWPGLFPGLLVWRQLSDGLPALGQPGTSKSSEGESFLTIGVSLERPLGAVVETLAEIRVVILFQGLSINL